MASCEFQVGPGLGFRNSRHSNVDCHSIFLGRSQEDGARPSRWPWVFERNFQQGRADHAWPHCDGLCFYFGFLGALGMSNGVEWTLQAVKMDLHWMGMIL